MGLSDIDEDDGPPIKHPTPVAKPAPPVVAAKAPAPAVVPVRATVVKCAPTVIPVKATVVTSGAAASASGARSQGSTGFDFDDLFGDQKTVVKASPTQQQSSNAGLPTPSANNVLDDLFAAQSTAPATAAPAPAPAPPNENEIYVGSFHAAQSDDLFDVSKPTTTQKHKNAESFLEAFENMGKKENARFDNKNSLENLTKNKDNNKINARLLALMNYYDVLGVAPTADEEEIKRAYKKKALQLHPDRVGRDQTAEEAELFKVITKANEVLTDAGERAKYDQQLRAAGYGAPAPQAPSPDSWYTQF